MPNIEFWLSTFVIFQGIWTGNAKKPYIFVIFQGMGDGPNPLPPPSGSAHVFSNECVKHSKYQHVRFSYVYCIVEEGRLGQVYIYAQNHQSCIRKRCGSVVECLTRDRVAAGSSLVGVTPLWSLSKTHLSYL